MIRTYDEILEAMKKKFCEKSGRNPDKLGDVGLRLQAVAGELYSLSCYGDFIIRQAFPQTANSQYLDMHAQLRGTKRKAAQSAKTKLVFSVPEPAQEDIWINSHVVCAVPEKPYIQFSIDGIAILRKGETSITASATALGEGEEYNVAANTITLMVNPPAGIASVTNPSPAVGGFGGENDEMIRRRLVNSFKVPPSGLTLTSMASVVEAIDEIIECRILKNDKTLDVYVRTADNTITTELRNKVKNELLATDLLGFTTNVICAKPVYVDVVAKGSFNSSKSTSTNDVIKDIVEQALSANGIGNSFELNELIKKCIHLQEVNQISFESNIAENGIVSIDNNQYLCLRNFEVIEDV